MRSACLTTIETIQSGIPVARIELLDALQVQACNAYSKLGLPETPMLFVEFHGSRGERRRAIAPLRRNRGRQRRRPVRLDHQRRGAHAGSGRRATTPIGRAWDCGRAHARSPPTSACRSRGLPIASRRPRPISPRAGLIAPIVGHVGDGNFHVTPLIDMDDPEALCTSARLVVLLQDSVRGAPVDRDVRVTADRVRVVVGGRRLLAVGVADRQRVPAGRSGRRR